MGNRSVWNSLHGDLRATVNTGTFEKIPKTFILQILYNFLLKFCYVVLVVIGLDGHCCKPKRSVVIIIIIIINVM